MPMYEKHANKPALRLCEDNRDSIEAVLKAANGRATAHTYTSLLKLERLAGAAEQELEWLGIPKADRHGAEFLARSGDSLPNSYKYAARTTTVVLTRGHAGWYLDHAVPSRMFPRQGALRILTLTEAQDAIVVRKVRHRYQIRWIPREATQAQGVAA